VPSTVLARRPDVSAAQASLLAAQARVGVAKAAWFPDISLTGSGGYASSEIGDIFKWSARAWGVGALLSLPIFDGGRREAGIQNARGEMDASLARYREQILVAFREVEDQLSALRLLAEQSDAQERAVQAAARSTSLSDVRYRNGLVSQLDLLDARRSELRNRRQGAAGPLGPVPGNGRPHPRPRGWLGDTVMSADRDQDPGPVGGLIALLFALILLILV
jgi:multidrug efflux system outer membrane protein